MFVKRARCEHYERHEQERGRRKHAAVPRLGDKPARKAREQASDRQRIGDRLEAVADAVRVRRCEVPQDEADERRDHDHGRRDRECPASPGQQQHRGPEKIKLLFHCQRPGMPDPPRTLRVVIRRIRDGMDEISRRKPDELQKCPDRHDQNERVVRREDAEGSSEIKPRKADGAVTIPLVQQEIRDQKARDDEKHAHAKLAERQNVGDTTVYRRPLRAGQVAQDDQSDGDSPQTVERGYTPVGSRRKRPLRAKLRRCDATAGIGNGFVERFVARRPFERCLSHRRRSKQNKRRYGRAGNSAGS